MALRIPERTREQLLASVKRFFQEHHDEEIGDLKAELFLDFAVREVGPTVYNQAIADAQAYLQERVNDLEGTCHEPELPYWTRPR